MTFPDRAFHTADVISVQCIILHPADPGLWPCFGVMPGNPYFMLDLRSGSMSVLNSRASGFTLTNWNDRCKNSCDVDRRRVKVVNINIEMEMVLFVVALTAEIRCWPMKPYTQTCDIHQHCLIDREWKKGRMHDLAKQNTPQVWLWMALPFSLFGWCLFKHGALSMWSHTAQERSPQSLLLHLT